MEKPFAPSCERNRDPILAHLSTLLKGDHTVLEVGSGTGQHAVYFGKNLPHVKWLAADRACNHEGIQAWIRDADLSNVSGPYTLDVADDPWQVPPFDVAFTANTLHIMSWDLGRRFLAEAGARLPEDGILLVYGPFNYEGNYTSASNAQFDIWLKHRDPESAIRHFEDVTACAGEAGLQLVQDYEMPANNRLLYFKKSTGAP